YAVDRSDDWLRTVAHRAHERAGHPCEAEQSVQVTIFAQLDQRSDDVVNVTAGREVAARARDDDGLHVVHLLQRAKRGNQLAIAFECQCVLPIGAVERNGRDTIVEAPPEVLRREVCTVHILGHCPVPTAICADCLSLPSKLYNCRRSASVSPENMSPTHIAWSGVIAPSAALPAGVRDMICVRRSGGDTVRETRPSRTRRSTRPVRFPLVTMRRRDSSLMVRPLGAS